MNSSAAALSIDLQVNHIMSIINEKWVVELSSGAALNKLSIA